MPGEDDRATVRHESGCRLAPSAKVAEMSEVRGNGCRGVLSTMRYAARWRLPILCAMPVRFRRAALRPGVADKARAAPVAGGCSTGDRDLVQRQVRGHGLRSTAGSGANVPAARRPT